MTGRDIQDLEELSKQGKCLSVTGMRKKIGGCDNINDLMEWNYETGEFEPATCDDCYLPKIAHGDFCWGLNKIRSPGTCAKSGWNDKSLETLREVILNDDIIKAAVDERDTPPHKTVCTCGKQFKTR